MVKRRYLNTKMICERCWWIWKRNLKSKVPMEFEEWLKNRDKPYEGS